MPTLDVMTQLHEHGFCFFVPDGGPSRNFITQHRHLLPPGLTTFRSHNGSDVSGFINRLLANDHVRKLALMAGTYRIDATLRLTHPDNRLCSVALDTGEGAILDFSHADLRYVNEAIVGVDGSVVQDVIFEFGNQQAEPARVNNIDRIVLDALDNIQAPQPLTTKKKKRDEPWDVFILPTGDKVGLFKRKLKTENPDDESYRLWAQIYGLSGAILEMKVHYSKQQTQIRSTWQRFEDDMRYLKEELRANPDMVNYAPVPRENVQWVEGEPFWVTPKES